MLKALLFLFILAANASNAQPLYKCKDPAGRILFTDKGCSQVGKMEYAESEGTRVTREEDIRKLPESKKPEVPAPKPEAGTALKVQKDSETGRTENTEEPSGSAPAQEPAPKTNTEKNSGT